MDFSSIGNGAFMLALVGLAGLLVGLLASYFWVNRKTISRGSNQQSKAAQSVSNLREFYNLTSSLINTINYDNVLDIALDMSITAFQTGKSKNRHLVSAALLFHDEHLAIQTARGLPGVDLRSTFSAQDGALAKVINTGEPVMLINPKSDPELKRAVGFTNCGGVYLAPLRNGLDIYGVLVFGHPDKAFFNRENREILNIITTQAINAMKNAQLYNALEQEKERLVDAEEEARRKLARDLHDGPTQSISAIAMRVNFARRMLEKKPANVEEELIQIEEMARDTTKEIRHMLFTLRPLVLESQGLIPALEAMAAKINETYDQNVIIDIDENTVEVLDSTKLGVLFYIVEEALTNARKHARADLIRVQLKSLSPDIGLLEIEDDGVGFDVHSVNISYENRGSLGLFTLKERAGLINGVLQIDSQPERGTKVQVFIPFSAAGIDQLRSARR